MFSPPLGGKCDKVPFSLPISMFDCLCSRLVGLLLQRGAEAIVLREVTGRSDPKSMRKQLCCSKLYFCQAESSERGSGISEAPDGRIVNMTDRGKRRNERNERKESCYLCEM